MKKFLLILLTLFITSILFSQNIKEIKIIHTNDIHSNFNKLKHLYSAINKLKTENSILVDSGDIIDETSYSCCKTNGIFNFLVLNNLQYECFTLGNNEFNFGSYNLKRSIKHLKIPVVSGNIFNSDTKELFIKPYTIISKNGIKIGFTGALADMNKYFYPPLIAPFYSETSTEEFISIYKEYCNEMKQKGCNIIVLLSHLGLKKDIEIAQKMNDFDLIIGGHSHDEIDFLKINNTSIVQAGEGAKKIGETLIIYNTKLNKILLTKTKLHEVKGFSEIPVSLQIKKLIDEYNEDELLLNKPIATINFPLSRKSGNTDTLPVLIGKIMKNKTKTDFFFHNLRSVRSESLSTQISLKDIYKIFFYNHLSFFTLKGSEIIKIIKKMPTLPENDTLILSGINKIKWKKNNKDFKILNLSPDISPEKTYTCSASAWVAYNGNRYFGFPVKNISNNLDLRLRDIFIEYIKKGNVNFPFLPQYKIIR